VPQIEVTFDIDADGILHVSAKDKATGREQSIKITASSGLSKDQVDQMVKDAERHAEEDRQSRAQIEARNKADTAHYQVQKFLQDNGDKLADADKQELQREMDSVKAALERNASSEELEKAADKLMAEWQKIGAKMYESTGGTPPPGQPHEGPGANGPADGGEDVVDGEYRTM
jgi:molecular chaperone DnaK